MRKHTHAHAEKGPGPSRMFHAVLGAFRTESTTVSRKISSQPSPAEHLLTRSWQLATSFKTLILVKATNCQVTSLKHYDLPMAVANQNSPKLALPVKHAFL